MRLAGPPAPAPRRPTLVAALDDAAAHWSGVTFVGSWEREHRLPWSQVRERAARAAAAYASWGVRPGERIAIVLRTEPAFLDAFFGAWLAGAVPVPLYPPVRLGRMEEYLESTARMLAVSGAGLVVSGGATRGLIGEAIAAARPRLGGRDAAALAAETGRLERSPSPGELGLVQFSSGSTVAPKPVALTHGALAAQVAALHQVIEPTARDVLVSWLPLYHDMGLIGGLLATMAYPGPAVLIPPEHFLARPAVWPRAVARHRGTISAAPSFAWAYCAERISAEELEGCDLSSWRLALNGAEPISGLAMRRFAARFAPAGFAPGAFVPVYGLSEAALAVTFSAPGRPLEGRGVDPLRLASRGEVAPGKREVISVGAPIPGVELEVRDDAGAPLPERRLGRIWVRGPSLMSAYLGDPVGTAQAFADGWLDTGDLGFVADGALHLFGRAKDVVVIRGANHAPEEFEAALDGLPGVRPGCAVAVGCAAEDGGEELLLLAERGRGAARDEAALEAAVRAAVLERTGIVPREVRILAPGTLPRTSSGKLRRREALRRHLSGTLDPPRPAGLLRLAATAARSRLAWARLAWARAGHGHGG